MFSYYWQVTPPRCLGDVVLTLPMLHVIWRQNDFAWCWVSVLWAVRAFDQFGYITTLLQTNFRLEAATSMVPGSKFILAI